MRSVQVGQEPVVISYAPPASAEPALPPAVQPVHEPLAAAAPLEPAPPEAISIEALREAAVEEGRREGFAQGDKEGRAVLEAEAARLHALSGALREALEQGIAGLEDVMVEIAFAAAARIVGEASVTPEGVRGVVREALRGARGKEGIVVRVAPADHRLLCTDGAARLGAEEAKVELAPDERVAGGGCIIETSGGTLDARLEVQFQVLLDTLARVRAASREGA
jgi:flagellar assembly protein FliH